MDMSVIGVLGSYMDNKVVIKVRYKDRKTYMSWKAVVKLLKLTQMVQFSSTIDFDHYWKVKEGFRHDIK